MKGELSWLWGILILAGLVILVIVMAWGAFA